VRLRPRSARAVHWVSLLAYGVDGARAGRPVLVPVVQ
jgi:hypothetical protein